MSTFEQIIEQVEPDFIERNRQFAYGYQNTRNRLRASWIPVSVDDETWMDLYQMAEQVEQTIALLPEV